MKPRCCCLLKQPDKHEESRRFAGILPDLNQDDPEVARYLIQNTLWWIGIAGFDGIREDTLPYVPRHFWRGWMTAIKREYPKLTVVGEVFDPNPSLVSFFQGGVARWDGINSKIDTLFDYPLMFPMRRAFGEGKPMRDITVMLAHDELYPKPQMLVTFIGNHDLQRFMNDSGATIAGLKLADTLLMTTRGIPTIYYGDEIAMPGGADPDNRHDFPGAWPKDPHNGFHASGRTPTRSPCSNTFAAWRTCAPNWNPCAVEPWSILRRMTRLTLSRGLQTAPRRLWY